MPQACPKIYHAAHLLFTNPQMNVTDAMVLAKYSKKELKVRRIRQAISKKKNWLKEAAVKHNSINLPQQISISNNTGTLSSMTNGSNTLKRGSETIVTDSTKTSSKKQKTESQQVKTRATAKVQLSSKSYRTPNQVMKADHERNEKLAQLQKAYEWAFSQKEKWPVIF